MELLRHHAAGPDAVAVDPDACVPAGWELVHRDWSQRAGEGGAPRFAGLAALWGGVRRRLCRMLGASAAAREAQR